MEIKEMTVEQIEERKLAIKEELNADSADLNALETEVRSLNDRLAEIKETAKAEADEARSVAEGAGEVIVENIIKENTMEERTFGIESMEYRNAWLTALKNNTPLEERAYATTDSHTAIPTMVSDKFFAKLKKLAPMMNEIELLQVAGSLKFVAQDTVNAAAAHTENSTVTPAADTIVSVTLGSKEFIKIIQISKNAETMSIDAFENWLVEMLGVDIARKIEDYIINDTTNGLVKAATWTTNTNQVLNAATTGYTYKDITKLVGLLPAGYDPNAKFLMNKSTLYNEIANIVTTSGQPIFVMNPEEGMVGRILGFPVIIDDYVSTSNKAVYFGDYKKIVGNLQPGGVEVARDESAGFMSASVMFRGLAHFDSKPALGEAFVRLVSTV